MANVCKWTVLLLLFGGCTITELDIPTAQGPAHLRHVRPIWTNYTLRYVHKGDETTIAFGTKTEHIDVKQLGVLIGAAIDAALKTQGIP